MAIGDLILATNPERIRFCLGEATGGGPADGAELVVIIIDAWQDEVTHKIHPARRIVMSRKSSELVVEALVTFLARDELDRIEMDQQEVEDSGEDEDDE